MFLRILKRDLKRKKVMNGILFVFIILASMFVASGLSNVLTVVNGTDYYLDKAGIGNYFIITMGDDATGHIEKALSGVSDIRDYRIESVVYAPEDVLLGESGEKLESKNTALFQSIESSVISFFDSSNEEITSVKEGHIYATGAFMKKNDLKAGDKIYVEHKGTKLVFVLDGKAKDALLGSDFMGNTRFIMNEKDMRELLSNDDIVLHYRGEIAYIDSDNTETIKDAIKDVPNISIDDGKSTIKMCYVMDMIVAFIILILSICLMLVSFFALKFAISFTISEEFREIGVMKAIGISNGKIRNLYIIKYLILAVVGAVIGLALSIPFGSLLIKSVEENMVLGSGMAIVPNIAGALAVIVIIVLFAYRCTAKVKKLSPTDAIRAGQTGERYKKKTFYRIGKSHTDTSLYMALNDIVSSPRRFMTIIVSFFICTLFVLILVNTTETMKSPNLVGTFGSKADLYITDTKEAMKDMEMRDLDLMKESMKKKADTLTEKGMPSKMSVEVQYKYKVTFNGKENLICCQQGVNVAADEYDYTEGEIPENENEIAITPQISQMTGAVIGDTMTIDFGEKTLDCVVTAYYESMNQLGKVIRLHELAPTDMKYCSNIMQYKVVFTDNPSEDEIENRRERIRKLYDNDDIMNATEYCIDCIQVVDTMMAVQYMLLGITVIVIILVVILMERAFITDEKSQIAILKAIGFKSRDVIIWQTYRFSIVGLIAAILAAVCSIPMTKLCISPVFGMMGAHNIKYNIVPFKVFVLYPVIIVLVTFAITWITAQYTRKIKSSDTAYIE